MPRIKKNMKLLPFPQLRQSYDFDCGAQVLQSILLFYGMEVREDQILKKAKINKVCGTLAEEMQKFLQNYGLKTKAGSLKKEQVQRHIDKGHPAILAIQAWSKQEKDWKKDWKDGHYVVAIGYDKQRFYFEDPSTVLKTFLNYKELEERWHDRDCYGRKYQNYGILVYGKKRKYNPK